MRDVLEDAVAWFDAGRDVAVATVVGIRGSAPRELGASMIVAIGSGGASIVRGNVSGGCVEGAVVEECREVLEGGRARVRSYGIASDDAFAVGLMCGGSIDVLIRRVGVGTADAASLRRLATASHPLVYALAVRGAEVGIGRVLGNAEKGIYADAGRVGGDGAVLLGYDGAGCRTDGEPATQLLAVPFGGPPRLVIVGAVTHGVALARLGAAAGYAVTVLDPREAFAVPERFPGAEVVASWPDDWLRTAVLDERSAVCVLSHDEKIDVPALAVALVGGGGGGRAGYVGAMGSRRTHDDRLDRLVAAGVPPHSIARLQSPIGLDLGGRSPEETALSILAEIVAARHGGTGRPLAQTTGPLHADRRPVAAPVTGVP